MNKRELYEKVYGILENVTPLTSDCGQLCNQACCQAIDNDSGMYLFPGEEVMYEDKPHWLRLEPSNFTYGGGKKALVAICFGHCDRKLRPLACRIFPLTPYIGHNGFLSIKVDSRAVPVCPLARANTPENMDEAFIDAVVNVFKLLARDREFKSFVLSLSRTMDEQEEVFRKFTENPSKKRTSRAIRRSYYR